MAGAGCAPTEVANTNPETSLTTEPLNQEQIPSDDFAITANATEQKGVVNVKWTVPIDMNTKGGFRLLNSMRPNLDQIENPFWYWFNGTVREADWKNIPSGKRYFRACQFSDNKCVRYSNEVEVEVK